MNSNIFTIFENIKEMLHYRNDNIDKFKEDIKNFNITHINEPIELYTDKTCVIFLLTKLAKKVIIDQLKPVKKSKKKDEENEEEEISDTNTVKEHHKQFVASHNNFLNYILIFNENEITSADKKLLILFDKILQQAGGLLSVFIDSELYYNPTKHELVDKHRKLTQDEIKALMSKYNIKSKSSLPLILKNSDPIAKWLGLKSGDIVEIDRYNPNSGLTKYYRACV